MPPSTTSLGAFASAAYLCCLYAFAVLEPAAGLAGLLHLSSLWGPGLLAAPFALLLLFDFATERRWRHQAAAWARITVLCELAGLAGFALRAKYPALEARWPTHPVEDPFYQFVPGASAWNVGAWSLIGLGLVGVLVHRVTATGGSARSGASSNIANAPGPKPPVPQMKKLTFNAWRFATFIAYSCTGLFVLAGLVVGSVWGAGYGDAAAYEMGLALLLVAAVFAWAGYAALRRSAPTKN